MTTSPVHPETRESVARAKVVMEEERARIVQHQHGAKEAVTVLLNLYPEALPALRVFIALFPVHGPITLARYVADATSHPFSVSTIGDPRRG